MNLSFLMLLLLGALQFYSVLSISKYFDYAYYSFYGLLVQFVIQLVSLWTILWQPVLIRWRAYLLPAYLLCLLYLSQVKLGDSVLVVASATTLIFSIQQAEILEKIKTLSRNSAKGYACELLGGVAGIVLFYILSAQLGFKGSLYFSVTVMVLNFLLANKSMKAVFHVALALLVCGAIQEPHPIISKRQYAELTEKGKILEKKWDPNGHVELIETSLIPGNKILLFEGGTLRSHIFGFDGDYRKLKKDYLASQSTGVWGLDVAFPHFVKEGTGPRVALLSCVGGQEILAAKAFGAKEIDVVDINKSAQEIVAKNASFSGDIYSEPVTVFHEDGRHFIENSKKSYDVIQIYSADSASFSSLLGLLLRPSSLITAEAIRSYVDHLNDKGILQITQRPFSKFRGTFREAFGRDIFIEDQSVLVFERDEVNTTLTTVAYKKGGWKAEEILKIKNWLMGDPIRKWKIILDPLASTEEKIKAIKERAEAGYFSRPSTDNWPFFKVTVAPFSIPAVQYLILFLIGMAVAFGISLFRVFLPFEMGIASFLMGASYSSAQSILIFCFQRVMGLPSLGLCSAMIWSLFLAALAALTFNRNPVRISKGYYFWALMGLTIAGFYFSDMAGIATLSCLVFLQALLFAKLISPLKGQLGAVFWYNGLGFAAGVIIFNLTFLVLGFFQSVVAVSVLYGLVAWTSRKGFV